MRGPVNVEADGDLVEVELASVTAEHDSRIVNDGGEVTVRFLGGDSTVDAVSRFGRVDSSLDRRLPSRKDESTAQGVSGGGSNRVVVIKASGDVHLLGTDLRDGRAELPERALPPRRCSSSPATLLVFAQVGGFDFIYLRRQRSTSLRTRTSRRA